IAGDDSPVPEAMMSVPCRTCRTCRPAPRWTVSSGALFLARSNPNNLTLVTDNFAPGGNELVNAGDFQFRYEPGWEIGLRRELNSCWDLEARYVRLDAWRATVGPISSAGGAVVRYATPLGNVAFPAELSGSYRSMLNSVELNARRRLSHRFELLAGFRYVGMAEQGLSFVHDIGPGLNTTWHDIGATNDLCGFQIGAEGTLLSAGRVSIGGLVKSGIYDNRARNRVRIHQNVGGSFGSAATLSHTAFSGEVAFVGTLRLTPRCVLKTGYQLLWLEGVAAASDQVPVSDVTTGAARVDTTGSPLYHGAFITLEWRR
ncbi:MAG: hypothetical protein JW818_13535, partial [Pirellulales bacterium]|nr:hypothetical protein [Pirellulales bacterium]